MEVERLIVTLIDREIGPFGDRLREIGAVDGVLDVDAWWHLGSTVLVTVDAADEDVLDDLEDLPFVASVQHDIIMSRDGIVMEPITVAPNQYEQVTAGLTKYLSYFRDGLRPRIAVPWTSNGFDSAVPVEENRRGAGVYVCVMDSGIVPTNSEFAGRTIIALPRRGLNSLGWHGNACAQIIGGNTLGMAPEVTFIDANCFGDSSSASSSSIIASMGDLADYVANTLTADDLVVLNMSFGGSGGQGVYDGAVDDLQNLGIVCFASSGNSAQDAVTSATTPAFLLKYGAVGATDYYLGRARFSNWGANVFCHGPGLQVPYIGTPTTNGGDDTQVTLISGTSFSGPYVVGCFVTWACGKKAPSSRLGVEFMQKQFLRACGRQNTITDKWGELDVAEALFVQADNSPISSSLVVDSAGLETVLLYGEAADGIGTRQLEVALTYGGTMTDYLLTNNPTLVGGVRDTTVGKFPAAYADHGCRIPGNGQIRIPIPDAWNEAWVSFYAYMETPTGNGIARPAWYFKNVGSPVHPGIGLLADFNEWQWFQNVNSGSTSEGSYSRETTNTPGTNNLVRVDIFIRFEEVGTPANSTFQVYLDGLLSYDRQNFQRYTSGDQDPYEKAFYIGNPATSVSPFTFATISNIRVSSTDTRGKDFMALNLNTVGNYNQFDLDGFNALTDLTDKLLARSQTAGQRVSGTLDFASIPDNGAISEVKLVSVFSVDSAVANPNALAHFVRSGTTDYDQSLVAPTAFREIAVTSLPTNPATASSWALADLNGMEFGLLSGNV